MEENMRGKKKYFIFNKETDFTRGYSENLVYTQQGLQIDKTGESQGTFFSWVLDSREKGTQWHRVQVESNDVFEKSIQILIYASETKFLLWKETRREIKEWIQDKELSIEEKEDILKTCLIKQVFHPYDFLLYEVKGRYLWIEIKLLSQDERIPSLKKIKIFFPKESLVQYLPEIYQKQNDFLERYLGIFQSMGEDLNECIRNVAEKFEPQRTSMDFLQWIASWLGIEDIYIWSEEQLRYLITHAMTLYQWRGTRRSIMEIVKLYTKEEPYIVEQHALDRFKHNPKRKELFQMLYGESPYIFTVIVSGNTVLDTHDYKVLLRNIEKMKPAHMEVNLVVLKPYIFLDSYCYLGINSVLGQYGNTVLDGVTTMPFAAIKG